MRIKLAAFVLSSLLLNTACMQRKDSDASQSKSIVDNNLLVLGTIQKDGLTEFRLCRMSPGDIIKDQEQDCINPYLLPSGKPARFTTEAVKSQEELAEKLNSRAVNDFDVAALYITASSAGGMILAGALVGGAAIFLPAAIPLASIAAIGSIATGVGYGAVKDQEKLKSAEKNRTLAIDLAAATTSLYSSTKVPDVRRSMVEIGKVLKLTVSEEAANFR